MKDAVTKIALKIDAIKMQIVKILIERLKCALAGKALTRVSSHKSSWALVSSGRTLLARKGVFSEISAILERSSVDIEG
jgi:hypothetical protein